MKLNPKNKPTLLFLTEFFPTDSKLVFTGGVEARTYYLSQQAKQDFQVKIIHSNSNKIAATPFSVFSRLSYIFTSFFKALKTEFDLIEGSNTTTYLSAFLAGKLKNKPTIAWFPDVLGKDWFKFGFFVGVFGYCLEKISLKLNWDQIIALSQSTKQKLIKANIPASKITVAYGGINPQEFKLKSTNKFPHFTIISIARLVKTKRLKDLVQAFSLINQQKPNTKLIIIGTGPEKQNLLNFINKLQLTNSVTIIKSLSRVNLIKTLKQSHLFCLPSVVEGFGLVTIEAMASGLPAVISNLPVHQEITHNGQGVLFFTPSNPKELSEKIFKLIASKKLYLQKTTQAKDLIKLYTWDKIYQDSNQAYQKTL
jgi:phosphatidyl-myo-inositol dimannoside synthase